MRRDAFDSLDPELKGPFAEVVSQPTTLDDIPAARLDSERLMESLKDKAPLIAGVEVEERRIPGPKDAPDVTIRIYRPQERDTLPALLWIHGGGYVLGNIENEEPSARQLALSADCVTVSVEYRLAPESPFPAPLEDCYATLSWMASTACQLGVDDTRIAIGGVSAGGGLAAGLALLARDRGEVGVIFQLLLSPMLNDCNVAPVSDTLPDSIFWSRNNNLIAWRSYLGCEPGGEGVSQYASAYRAGDLEGLPSTYIAVGDLDLFVEEDVEYAQRLMAAGVPTELHVYPGACHGIDMIAPEAGISVRFTSDYLGALKRALHYSSCKIA
jgi:acetyl esterase/lipase